MPNHKYVFGFWLFGNFGQVKGALKEGIAGFTRSLALEVANISAQYQSHLEQLRD